MTNPLTGDYEAVVQIAIRQINGLLGTLHQNSDKDVPLKLLHSLTSRVGDRRIRPPDVGVFGDWVIATMRANPGVGLQDLRTRLIATVPPGAARMFTDAFDAFDRDWVIQLPPDVVRGIVKLQVSSPTISVPAGSATEVIVNARIRAKYYPDPGTTELPAPVHGQVAVTFEIRTRGRRLHIEPSAQDAKITFLAAQGSGLTVNDENTIATHLRRFIRESLRLLPVDLPQDFKFTEFIGLGPSGNEVVALPFQLSAAPAPASGPQSLTQSFLGSSGFGFAASKDNVNRFIDLDAIRQEITKRQTVLKLSILGVSRSVTYRYRYSSGPTLTFKNGGIEIAAQVEAETSKYWAPNGWVRFRQLLTFVVDPASDITLDRSGDPVVDESWFIPHGLAITIVTAQIDKALRDNASSVNNFFAQARDTLVSGLTTFDAAATAWFTAIDVTTSGIAVRGEISTVGSSVTPLRRPPIVEFEETHQGAAFTALESWVPAGRIDRLIWTWVEGAGPEIWSGVQKSVVDEHRFILDKPPGITNISQICLRLEGSQIWPDGSEVSVTGGATCQVQEPEFEVDIPSWWEPLTIPIWTPNPADTGALRDAIAGHVSVQAGIPADSQQLRNALVYFAEGADHPLDSLITALTQRRDDYSLVTTVVLPAGTFDASRLQVEGRLGLPREGFDAPVHFTEDDERGWTRTFGASSAPSMYLINARREFVWKHEGEPDPAEIAAALDKYLLPTAPFGFRPLRLTVSPGDPAPDAFFEDDGQQYALHRMRGREVFLNFFLSWSTPCLTELQRLQSLQRAGRDGPFIVAFHGGVKRDAIDDVRKRLSLSFSLVQDSQQRLAQRYGVRCWPTTIKVDANGRVEQIQFGTTHEHERPPTDHESKPKHD